MLYLIATPIGNLADLTFRAKQTMGECDYLLCEDTRRSRILLNHYEIQKPLKSFHAFNEAAKESSVLRDLEEGKQIGLLSDAGTPGISDPGARIVAKVHALGLPLTALPGPSACIMALSLSGLPTHRFEFLGFPPRKRGKLTKCLQEALDYPGTSILYESPHRIEKTLALLHELAPDSSCVVARELTKKFEELLTGTPKMLLDHFHKRPPKGEFVLLIA